MKILKLNEVSKEEIIANTANALMAGKIVIYPTETCYGIGVDATNQKAVDKLLTYKERREGKPLSIAVTDEQMASKYVEINEIAHNLYKNYLPGPITVVSKSKNNVAKGIASESGTIGIRIPDYQLILDIIKAFGKPITSTSANMSYGARPYSIKQLISDLPQKQKSLIDLIIDAGTLPTKKPSTVVDTTLNNLNIMREGKLLIDQINSEKNAILNAKTALTDETIDFGALCMLKFIDIPLKQPLIFMLNGELGVGKTQFTKGIAKQLGIKQTIKSPSYNLINEYDYKRGDFASGKLIHADLWRVESEDALLQLGLESYMKLGNILVIEWADKFGKNIIELANKNNGKLLIAQFNQLKENVRDIQLRLA